jgi:hypothetical protein
MYKIFRAFVKAGHGTALHGKLEVWMPVLKKRATMELSMTAVTGTECYTLWS